MVVPLVPVVARLKVNCPSSEVSMLEIGASLVSEISVLERLESIESSESTTKSSSSIEPLMPSRKALMSIF